MVLYFSGTGNSRHVAQQIAERTGDTTMSLNLLIKHNKKDALQAGAHPFVFVCPVYAWRIPRVVEEYIRETPFEGTDKAYFVLTCGGESANALQYVRKLCVQKGWQLQGFAEIVMPDNYIVMFPALNRETCQEQLRQAEEQTGRLAASIAAGERFTVCAEKGLLGKLESGAVNGMFYAMYVGAKGFHAGQACNGCGKCATLCPLGNIHLREGRPAWASRCTHCMACICGCPTQAIEYKNKTQGKPRYQYESFC